MALLKLAQDLLRFQTVTPEDNGCLAFIATFLENLGFTITWLDKNNIKNLFATKRVKNTRSAHLCFAGHTDVVPTGSGWTYPPFQPTVSDGMLYARGTVDMKCAIACWLEALKEVDLSSKNISILLTSDEEAEAVDGLRTTLDFLATQSIDLFILGEPTALKTTGDCVKIGRRGSVTAVLKCYGQQGHIAYPHFAQNALDILDCVFKEIEFKLEGSDVFPFGPCKAVRTSIDVGNKAENVIPGVATMMFGVRFNTLYDVNSMKLLIEDACKKHCEKYDLQISLHGNPFIAQNQAILSWIKECVPGAAFDAKGATSDGRFLSQVAPVIECGFLENQAHQVDECVLVEDLERMKTFYKAMIEKAEELYVQTEAADIAS